MANNHVKNFLVGTGLMSAAGALLVADWYFQMDFVKSVVEFVTSLF